VSIDVPPGWRGRGEKSSSEGEGRENKTEKEAGGTFRFERKWYQFLEPKRKKNSVAGLGVAKTKGKKGREALISTPPGEAKPSQYR